MKWPVFFIATHLKVVKISRDEQRRLDGRNGSGTCLKQSMPDGWAPGDYVYERLRVTNIDFKFYPSARLLEPPTEINIADADISTGTT